MTQPDKADLKKRSRSQHSKSIYFPEGLPAFENVREFLIIANEEEAPFLWLQAVSVPNLAFVMIDPFVVYPGYRPDVSDDDVALLEIEKEEDVFILSIVNLSQNPNEGITANLVGPVVLNWRKKVGKQVVLQNHQNFSVKYRIDDLDPDEIEQKSKNIEAQEAAEAEAAAAAEAAEAVEE
jgi:flagellar assembly factor FliW